MTCGEYVENMLIFAQYSTHILSNQQLVTSTQVGKMPCCASDLSQRWPVNQLHNGMVGNPVLYETHLDDSLANPAEF